MEWRIFDLNDGFLRKTRFLNIEKKILPVTVLCTETLTTNGAVLGNRLESIERFRDLSLNLAKSVTFVNNSLSFK